MKRYVMKLILACMLGLNTAVPVFAEEMSEPSPSPSAAEEEATESAEEEVSEETPPAETAAAETAQPEEPSETEETVSPETEPESSEESAESASDPAEDPGETETVWAERLIVIGADALREEDHVISVYGDMVLLGFADADALKEGCAYYRAHAAHAEPDGIVIAAEEGGDLKDAPNEISPENNPIDQLQELLAEEETVSAGSKPLIALIDTGAAPDSSNIISAVSVLGEDPADDNGHGSRMTSLICAEDPAASILSIKALDANGHGTMSSVYAGMEYAIEQGADIIALCMSAAVSADNQILFQEIDRAAELGITVVGAAGNSGLDGRYFVPSGSASAVIIGSCNSTGAIRSFSNYGETTDYLVVSDSTSEAAAVFCGLLSNRSCDQTAAAEDPRVFTYGNSADEDDPAGGSEDPADPEDDSFYSQCNAFFYGDAYYWAVPDGDTTTAHAKLIPGYQQEILKAKTGSANGYNVQFQNLTSDSFQAGHGYAVYASTHSEAAVSSWGSSVHETEFHGSYEAWGKEFDSSRQFTINAKSIPDFAYLGVVVSQNSTSAPSSRAVTSLSKAGSANVKLGEENATYWTNVPGMNKKYWEGWDHTSSGDEYPSFRVDFYYRDSKPKHNLTIRYLEEGTENTVAGQYGPAKVKEDASYSVTSPDVEGYELVNPSEKTVSGTMPHHDVEHTVYYRRVYKITTKVINGMITLDNTMEREGTTGDDSYQASGAVTGIHAGEARTIRYENKPDHLLDYVKIDGKEIDPKLYPKAYLFSDINEDHTVEVRYAPCPVPEDAKQVFRSGRMIDGKMVTAGEELTYTVKVINTFHDTRSFEVTDRIPEYTAYVPDSADEGGSCEDGTLKWSFLLEPEEEKTVSFKVTVLAEGKDRILKNAANVKVNDYSFTTNETENPVLPDPVKHVSTEEGEDRDGHVVPVDERLRYTVTVKNPGSTAQEFTITDAVDENQTADPASISDGGKLNGAVITWTVTVPADSEYTVSFTAVPKDLELTIPNKAEVTSGGCPKIETNQTLVYTPVRPVKAVTTMGGRDLNGKAISAEDEFLYHITFTNPYTAEKEFTVHDAVSEAVTILEAGQYTDRFVKNGAGASISGQEAVWTLSLASQEQADLYLRCRLNRSDVIFTNQASVTADETEIKTNEVENWSARIIINAEIQEYWEPYGKPSFMYDIQDGSGAMWHRMIIIDPDTKKGQAVFDVPSGHDADTWKITDEAGSRYRFISAAPETENVSVTERQASASISKESRLGIADYLYGITDWSETSHLDALINRIDYQRT